MEVLSSLAGLDITIESPLGELEKLAEHGPAGEILLANDIPPYNHPTDKILFLKLRKNQKKKIAVEYIPQESDWNNLKCMRVSINPEVYDKIYFSGRIVFEPPQIPGSIVSLLIQDRNAV